MKKIVLLIAGALIIGLVAGPVCAQRAVEPNELKVSPGKYRNAYIKLNDVFMNFRVGWPQTFIEAGYTQDKYIGFSARGSGIGCFLRRNAQNEEIIAQIKPGDRITIKGYVKQPKIRGRFNKTWKLNYILEVSSIEKGWQ